MDEVEVLVLMPKIELVMIRTSLDLNVREGNVDALPDTSTVNVAGESPAVVGELEHLAKSDEILEFGVLSFSSDAAIEFGPNDDSDGKPAIEDELRESVKILLREILPEKGEAD